MKKLKLERISKLSRRLAGRNCLWTASSVKNVLSVPEGTPPGVFALRPCHRQFRLANPLGTILRCALVLASIALPLTASASPRLEAAMKVLAKDLAQVQEPTKAANPADVKDTVLDTAVVRARLMSALLQQIADSRGKVENGLFVAGEMSPPGIGALPAADLAKKLDLYARYLGDARSKLGVAEGAIEVELKKPASARDFTALKKALNELGAVIGAAHKVFKPATP